VSGWRGRAEQAPGGWPASAHSGTDTRISCVDGR
jgi:hypothetical protein